MPGALHVDVHDNNFPFAPGLSDLVPGRSVKLPVHVGPFDKKPLADQLLKAFPANEMVGIAFLLAAARLASRVRRDVMQARLFLQNALDEAGFTHTAWTNHDDEL